MTNRPYREPVGALAWLALGTLRSPPARLGHNPDRVHWDVAKRVVRYLKGTNSGVLCRGASLRRSPSSRMLTGEVTATTDAQSCGAFGIKIGDGVVGLKSKKQPCAALSSTEAEYMALFQASQESVWNMALCQASNEAYAQR